MQASSLRRRCAASGSMTVLGDLAQATGPHAYEDWDRIGNLLSDHGDWRVDELSTSYRVPAEIMEFVAPLARTVAPTLAYPQAVRRAGDDAVRSIATEPWKLIEDTINQAIRLTGSSDGHTPRSIAVIVPDDSSWLDEISRGLDETDGLTDELRATVSVLAAAQAKGMEYDHVLVVEPATIADRGPAGLRQLYIALTRSTQSLTVLHASPLPDALTNTGDPTGESPTEAEPGTVEGDVLEIGTDIRVRVIGHTTGGNYKVEAISPATDRPLLLAVRHGSTPPTVGAQLDGWVLRHQSNISYVTVEERGRTPISTKMATRYVEALSIFDELANGAIPTDARSQLSELKGMANRCLRLDQSDWLDVWRILGSPDKPRLNELRDLAVDTHRALASGTPDLSRVQADLERSGWAEALAEARGTLVQRQDTAVDPVLGISDSPAVPQQPEPKDSDFMPITTDAVIPKAGPSADLVSSLETSTAADRMCKTHEAVRFELMAALLRADLQPSSSSVIDVNCSTKDGYFLYEVLGAGLSTYADLRSGAVRLLEINHTLSAPADRLHLVLSEQPAEDWSATTVHGIFGVHVLWRTPESWGGLDTKTALGGDGENH